VYSPGKAAGYVHPARAVFNGKAFGVQGRVPGNAHGNTFRRFISGQENRIGYPGYFGKETGRLLGGVKSITPGASGINSPAAIW
jgi:hypothetical protein